MSVIIAARAVGLPRATSSAAAPPAPGRAAVAFVGIVGAVAGALWLGRMFVRSLSTR